MNIIETISEILNKPIILWPVIIFTVVIIGRSIYILYRSYVELPVAKKAAEEAKKEKEEFDKEFDEFSKPFKKNK